MKSFVSALVQGTVLAECEPTPLRHDDEPDNYVAALDRENMTTVELADFFDVPVQRAMKVLCRLEGDMRVRRVGSEKSSGQRKTILWSTRMLASRLHISYYSALAACKQLELSGVVRRDGVDRSRPKQPHIIWKLK